MCGDEEIKNASAETLVKTALDTAKGKRKVVLLLHDSASCKETAKALPEIITAFKEQGYAFCTY